MLKIQIQCNLQLHGLLNVEKLKLKTINFTRYDCFSNNAYF